MPDYAAHAVLTLGLMPGLSGLNSLLRPAHSLSLLGFPAPADPEGRRLAHALVRMAVARNLTMTLTTVVVWFVTGADRRMLGWTMLAGMPVALIDGFVSRGVVRGMEWGHWVFVPVSLGLGARLVGWI